jgi:hypothetical protein
MGVLSAVLGPIMGDGRLSSLSLVMIALGSVVLLIAGNVLKQLFFKNSREPPVVFHFVPFIGSTITYGIDPVKFFFNCRQKVSAAPCGPHWASGITLTHAAVRRCFHLRAAW